jgi:hypothetical protein
VGASDGASEVPFTFTSSSVPEGVGGSVATISGDLDGSDGALLGSGTGGWVGTQFSFTGSHPHGPLHSLGTSITLQIPGCGAGVSPVPGGLVVVGSDVVGSAVVGSKVVGSEVVGSEVVGSEVVGAAVVGSMVVGSAVVGDDVVGSEVAG